VKEAKRLKVEKIRFKPQFHAEAIRGTENDIHLPGWPDSHGANWFITSAEQELTLIATGDFHRVSFR